MNREHTMRARRASWIIQALDEASRAMLARDFLASDLANMTDDAWRCASLRSYEISQAAGDQTKSRSKEPSELTREVVRELCEARERWASDPRNDAERKQAMRDLHDAEETGAPDEYDAIVADLHEQDEREEYEEYEDAQMREDFERACGSTP